MARKKFLVSFELPFNESHAFEDDMGMGGGGGGGGGCDADDVKLVRETTFFAGIANGLLLLLLLLVMASLTSPHCEIEFEAYKFFMKFVLKSKLLLLSFSLPPAINSMVSHVADIFGLSSLSMLLIDLSMFDIYDVLLFDVVLLLVIVGD